MNNFKQSWEFLKECKKEVWVISILFIGAILLGLFFPLFFVDYIKKFMEEVLKSTQGLGFFQLFSYILQNNLLTALMGTIFGLVFGIVPLTLSFFNGYVLGFVSNKVIISAGVASLWRLLPHGVFELPALIISLALGLKIGTFLLSAKDKRKRLGAFILSIASFFVSYLVISSIVLSFFSIVGIKFEMSGMFSLLFFVFLAFLVLLGSFIGTRFLSIADRKLVMKTFKYRFLNSMRVFLYIVIPLLIIAALIETSLILFLA